MPTEYDDYEEYLKKTLASKGVYYFGPMRDVPLSAPSGAERLSVQNEVEPAPMKAMTLGTLYPSYSQTPDGPPVPQPAPIVEPPKAPVPPQDAMGTALLSGPTDLVDRVRPRFRQFTVAFPTPQGLQMALRVTLEPSGHLCIQGPMQAYAMKVVGRSLEGQTLEAATACFFKLARTTWGPGSQVFKVNVD